MGTNVVSQNPLVLLVHRLISSDETVLGVYPRARGDTARLQRQSRLVDLLQDVVHRVVNGARDRAVDGRGRGLVLERPGVGDDATGGNGPAPQRPQETLVPVLAHVLVLDVGERTRDALVGVVHRPVDGRTVLGREAILLVPDVERRFLERKDRKSTRLNSSHSQISYAVFC